jgi:hypothetical protein
MGKNVPALTVEEPADKQLNSSTFRSDLVEEALMSRNLIEETAESVCQALLRPLTFSKNGCPIGVGSCALQWSAFRSTSLVMGSCPGPK